MSRIINLEGWIDVIAGTAYTAAGTSTLTSAALDTGAEFDSYLVLAKFGTAAADNTVTTTSSATSGGTYAANGVSAVASTATTHVCLRVEGGSRDSSGVTCRYIKTVCARGTSTTLEYCFVIPYSSKTGLFAPASDWTTAHSFTGYIEPTA